jgi:hypothetical protein
LHAFVDADQPSIIFRAAKAESEQFLQHHGDLDSIGCCERVELKRMTTHRQLFVVCGSSDGPVDVGELTAVGFVPGPDFGWGVGSVCHGMYTFIRWNN